MICNKTNSFIEKINHFQEKFESFSDQQIKDKTLEFKTLFKKSFSKAQEEALLNQILPEAFAIAREAFKRVLNINLTNTQLSGAFYLHKGNIVQIKTGAGDEISIFLSAYLNSLTQKGVHVAFYDENSMLKHLRLHKPAYNLLGITAECILKNGNNKSTKEIYIKSDIIYSDVNQFALDYILDFLREPQDKHQKPLNYLIVKNADITLIDLLYTNYSNSKDGKLLDEPLMIKDFISKYPKFAGITPSIGSEKSTFKRLYNINTIILPTEKKVKRVEYKDIIYRSEIIKFRRLIDEIKTVQAQQRPIAIVMTNEEKAKYLFVLLKKNNIKHNVVTRDLSQDALRTLAYAGKRGSVSIINGELTPSIEIILGGDYEYFARKKLKQKKISDNDPDWEKKYIEELKKEKEITNIEAQEISKIGGLHVIGIEHHRSDRYDEMMMQLSTTQGFNGSSRFFTSIEDKVFENINIDKITDAITSITKNSDEVIKSALWLKIISKIIINAQRQFMKETKKITNYNADFTGRTLVPIKDKDKDKEKVKINRNSPCPCGSGKKYKNCCLKKEKS